MDGERAERIWRVRESALGAVTYVPGVPALWEGWEDSAVPPEKLGAYLRKLSALVAEFGYIMPIYGHFGQGCIHTRMNYDMVTVEGVRKYREFIERAADIVLEFGGSISGEHGDGQSRGALLPKMFGTELMQAFREFKALWDPDNRMNPGKMMGTPEDPRIYQPGEKLRVGPGYEAARPHTHFAFPDDDGAFSNATMRCVGVGACRKTNSGTMCPSYMATRDEQHSTRGRAHLLWELMQSDALPDKWQNEQVHEALDLCLSCKACKSECPVKVDMATYKAEFLAQHYKGRTASAAALSLRLYGPLGEVCVVRTELRECGAYTARRGDTGETRRRHCSTTHPSTLCQTQLPERAEQDSGEPERSEDGSSLAGYLEQLPAAAGAGRGGTRASQRWISGGLPAAPYLLRKAALRFRFPGSREALS